MIYDRKFSVLVESGTYRSNSFLPAEATTKDTTTNTKKPCHFKILERTLQGQQHLQRLLRILRVEIEEGDKRMLSPVLVKPFCSTRYVSQAIHELSFLLSLTHLRREM